MILINLLPHREQARKQRRENFYATLVLSGIVGAILLGAAYFYLDTAISNQNDRNQYLTQKNAELDAQIKQIAGLQEEIDALQARKSAVEDLQTDRNLPVHLLDELVRQTPEGVYLSSVNQAGMTVTLTGTAQSNERISEFLRNAASRSIWLSHPQLIEIQAAMVNVTPRDQRRLYNFKMTVDLQRPAAAGDGQPQPAAVPASQPAQALQPAPAATN